MIASGPDAAAYSQGATSQSVALALETMYQYTAYFADNDPREVCPSWGLYRGGRRILVRCVHPGVHIEGAGDISEVCPSWGSYRGGRGILDYGNFKLTNQVARNEGSIFHSHLVSGSIVGRWPLVAGSIGTLFASGLNGHRPISFSAVV